MCTRKKIEKSVCSLKLLVYNSNSICILTPDFNPKFEKNLNFNPNYEKKKQKRNVLLIKIKVEISSVNHLEINICMQFQTTFEGLLA